MIINLPVIEHPFKKFLSLCSSYSLFYIMLFFPSQSNFSLPLSEKDLDTSPLSQLPHLRWREEDFSANSPLVAIDMGEWEVHPDHVVVETRLGQGMFGDIYTGVLLRGEVASPTDRKGCGQTNVVIQILPCKIVITQLTLQ